MSQIIKIDTSLYEKKTLTFDEANILTSIYSQTGNHSAVTGGIGTEQLTDFSNTLDVSFYTHSSKGIKHKYGLSVGVDIYTSASSDEIDTKRSSASSQDERFYPSLSYAKENLSTGNAIGTHLSFSNEYDYTSFGTGIHKSWNFNNKRTKLNISANGFYDIYDLYIATGLRQANSKKGKEGSASRQSYDASFALAQVMTPKLQMAFIIDMAYQAGFLSTPFHRVYRSDGQLTKEVLPDTRFKVPLGIRVNAALTDKVMLRTFYRYFQDSWSMSSHTAHIELPIAVLPQLNLSPYCRYYQQSGNAHFGAFQTLPTAQQYVTSDYDLSDFNSLMFGMAFKYNPFKQYRYFALSNIESRMGYYMRFDGLSAWIVTFGASVMGDRI